MSTQYISFNIKKKITLNYTKSAIMGFFFQRESKNEFETAVVHEPSVFEPLKFYCIVKYFPFTSTLNFGARSSHSINYEQEKITLIFRTYENPKRCVRSIFIM